MMIVWCFGVVNAQNTTQILSGKKIGNYEAANSIQSTQVLSKGTTSYIAGNQIALKPGFHAKAGSEFIATIDNPSNYLTIMTCNLGPMKYRDRHSDHAKVIKASGADIVSVQEVKGESIFNALRSETGFKGEMCTTMKIENPFGDPFYSYGIALLWNEAKLGKPLSVTPHKIERKLPSADSDERRAYIVAQWDDFVVIATHLSTDVDDNKRMVTAILAEDVVINYNKPIFIAGDLNPRPKADASPRPDGYETKTCLQANGFEILNVMHDMQQAGPDYPEDPYTVAHYHLHTTSGKNLPGGQVDLILWKNQKPDSRIVGRGVPECLLAEDKTNDYPGGQYRSWRFEISDHHPYVVKVKLK